MPSLPEQASHWRLPAFLEHFRFVHRSMPDHAYAWVLGAGASKPSGIPLAGDLVHRWLGELQRRSDDRGLPLQQWATAENLGIDKFRIDQAASFYSRVYERRFGDNPEEGFACLEELMSGRDPSPGYSILAQILDRTPHKVVISTNFDNLVADALSIYTSTFPLVIGHESLANFVKIVSRRPVICKIHRDLLLGPKSDTRSLRRLHESWAAALRALFSQYTPLFVGYGGNDDSLMDLLESLDPGDIKGQLVWCYYEPYEPGERIRDLVAQHRGALVPVPDFDMLMVLLGDQLAIEPIDHKIEERARERAQSYRKQLIALDTTRHPEVRRILKGAFERAGGDLAFLEKARAELSVERRRQVFEEGLESYPDSKALQGEFGVFLFEFGLDLPRARKLLEAAGSHHNLVLLESWVRDFEAAERALAKAGTASANPQVLLGILRERQGASASAEQAFLTAATNEEPFARVRLATFYLRQDRIDESVRVLDAVHAAGPADARCIAVLAAGLWLRGRDDERAGKMFSELFGVPSASAGNFLVAASYFAAHGDGENYRRAREFAATRPMIDWFDVSRDLFLNLYDAFVAGGDGTPHIERLRTQFSLTYRKLGYFAALLMKLVEAKPSRLTSGQRKFLGAIAQAIGDPARVGALNNFPQWRGDGEASAAKADA